MRRELGKTSFSSFANWTNLELGSRDVVMSTCRAARGLCVYPPKKAAAGTSCFNACGPLKALSVTPVFDRACQGFIPRRQSPFPSGRRGHVESVRSAPAAWYDHTPCGVDPNYIVMSRAYPESHLGIHLAGVGVLIVDVGARHSGVVVFQLHLSPQFRFLPPQFRWQRLALCARPNVSVVVRRERLENKFQVSNRRVGGSMCWSWSCGTGAEHLHQDWIFVMCSNSPPCTASARRHHKED